MGDAVPPGRHEPERKAVAGRERLDSIRRDRPAAIKRLFLAAAVAAAVIPGRRLARLSPVEALRAELRATYVFWTNGGHNLSLGFEYAPAFTDPATVHNYGLVFGWQLN